MTVRIMNNKQYQKINGYWIPETKIKNEQRPIRKYGHMRWKYLRESEKLSDMELLSELEITGQLMNYLADIEEEAEKIKESRSKMMEERKIDSNLQKSNYQAYLQGVLQIEMELEEIILNTLIYV
ncbi:MAG: TnpV protein [Finegoldia sp.]|uniref:TnpV protein n=1 Tax=Finegoldia sp. TaxID=1981334 RepID=UPI0039964E9B